MAGDGSHGIDVPATQTELNFRMAAWRPHRCAVETAERRRCAGSSHARLPYSAGHVEGSGHVAFWHSADFPRGQYPVAIEA
jgi:hypothetical protein